jgi:Cysteine-rich CWC
MCKHEEKHCPRCNLVFECKPGNIMQCRCSAIQLSAEERAYMESKFEDCLCVYCLGAMQKEYLLFKEGCQP